jgi:hypothetical protein
MALNSFQLLDGATGFTVTGGTAKTFAVDGQEVKGGIHCSDSSNTDFKTRLNVAFRSRMPVRQPNGTYSKGKLWISLFVPYQNTDGTVDVNNFRYESEYSVNTPAATILNGRRLFAQLIFDSELDMFHTAGSLT